MRHPFRVGFVRDVALTAGTQVCQALLAMVAGILVARSLGPTGKGTLSVLVALGSMAVLLGSFGVNLSSVYFLGRFKAEAQRRAIVSNTLLVGSLGGIVTGAALALVGVALHRQLLHTIAFGTFLLFVLAVPFSYFNEFARRTALGVGRVVAFNLPDLIGGGGLLAGTAASLVLFGNRLLPLVVLRVVIEVAISVLLVLFIRRAFRFRFRPSTGLLRRQLNYGIRNYTGTLLWLFLLQSDLILCNHFLGTGPTGVYSVAVSLSFPATMLAGIVGTWIFQRVSSDASRPNRIANTNRVMRLLFPVLGASMLVLGLLATWLVALLYGEQFSAASTALVLLLPGLFALGLELVPMNFIAGEGSSSIIFRAPLAGLLTNVVANLFVIPRWGINGAAVTSSIGYAIVFFLVLRHYLLSTGSSLSEAFVPRVSDIKTLLGASATRSLEPRPAKTV